MHEKLGGLVLEAKGEGMEVVLHSLLITLDKAKAVQKELAPISVEELEDERRVVLEWLLKQLKCKSGTKVSSGSKLNSFQQRLFLECSPALLAQVSTVHLTFFQEYVHLLMAKAEELDQYSLPNIISSYSQTLTSDHVGTRGALEDKGDESELIIRHFTQLARSGEPAREVCMSLLKSKIQPPLAEKFHLPPVVGTIWNRILHAISI